LSGRAQIIGIGNTQFTKQSGRSEIHLSVEAIRTALDDAGISAGDVDGLTTFTFDTSPESEISRNLGFGLLRFFARTPFGGGGGCATIMHAALAVEAGAADIVVCYRGFNERSGRRYGQTARAPAASPEANEILRGYYNQYGLITPADSFAMLARRYMHETGATSEDFGRVAVVQRQYASTNPLAWYYRRPLTLEQHQRSRMIVDPLRLYDCCQESDGAVAIVVASERRARTLDVSTVAILAAAQSLPGGHVPMASYNQPSLATLTETVSLGEQLWQAAGIGPADVQVAILYDHFSPFVLMQLESLGFCGFGDAAAFVAAGEIRLNGRLPVNTNGGQLGEAYIHGMNGIAEAVRQLRGTAVNLVPGARRAVVTSGPGIPTSGLVLEA
jgi:acetyl-CoA acetyltransferase